MGHGALPLRPKEGPKIGFSTSRLYEFPTNTLLRLPKRSTRPATPHRTLDATRVGTMVIHPFSGQAFDGTVPQTSIQGVQVDPELLKSLLEKCAGR